MKAAFTEWNGRVAPVFDVSRTVLMVETKMSDNTGERLVDLPSESPSAKIAFLAEQDVDILVCGAISRQVQGLAEAAGIQVHPFVAGEIRDIVNAWIRGDLEQVSYSMPGCRRCRRQLRQRSKQHNK